MSKIFSFISIFVFVAASLTAQQTISTPTKAIIDLKEGVLIVRLTSELKKINALNELLENGDLSYNTRSQLPERIKKIKIDRDTENALWIEHFKTFYNFSEVLFAYDTLRKEALWNDDGKNCFLGADMKIDPSLSLNGRSYLMLYKGNISDGSGAEAVIFRDANFKQVEKPFPYYVKTTGVMYVFNRLFKSSIADNNNIARIVRKIDRKVKKFYRKKGGIHSYP